MNKIVKLTNVFLKNSLSQFGERKNKKANSTIIIYIIAILYLAIVAGGFSYTIIDNLKQINQQEMFIGIILLAIGMIALIQTIFSSMSLLYYSKDNEYILPLPIKPKQIVIAKTNVLIITEYAIIAIIGLIPLIVYGILNNLGVGYYISTVLVLGIFPIIPILFSSLLVLIIMSFSKITKNKNRFQVISTFILLILTMLISYKFSAMGQTEDQMVQVLTQTNGLVEIIKSKMPTLEMAIEVLTNNSYIEVIKNIIYLTVLTGILYIMYVILGEKLYLKGAVGNLSSGEKTNKKIDEKEIAQKTSLLKTYVGKEIKTLLRNPIFLMQCVLPGIIFPVIMVVFSAISINSEGVNIIEIAKSITVKDSLSVGVLLICIMQFFAMFIYISITAISRDGKNAIFMKYIPVKISKQIEYKIIPNIVMNIIMEIITFAIVEFVVQIPIIFLMTIIVLMTIMAILQSYMLILVDIKKPKLDWNSEYTVVKQNMNLMWPMIFGLSNIMIIFAYASLFPIRNSYIIIGSLIIIYVVVTVIVRKYIQKNINKLFEKIY